MMPPDCLFLSRIQFCTRFILRISGVSRDHHSSTFRTAEFIGSEFWDTPPWTFFLRIATYPWLLCSRPQAEVALTITLSTWATSTCFQTCNDGTLDVADNYMTIFFILPATDKESLTSVAGLAFRLFMFFRQSVSFTFGTEEDACSGGTFLASLHFIPRCPHSLPWHACVEKYKRLFLNKTQLSSAEDILQSSARCKSFFVFSCHGSTLGGFVDQQAIT